MKQFTHTFICILICLVPTLLAGQALQVQNQLPEIHSPFERFLANSNQLTDPPLLRISNIGSSGQDGVSIELIPLSLMSTGPMLLLDSPVPGTPASGALSLLPNFGGSKLIVSNIGSSGQDGVQFSVVPPVLNSFFDVFYNCNTGAETHQYGDPDFDLLFTRTYDKATPKLFEKVSSNSIGLDSFFDVFYDLSLASHGVGFGNNPNNLCLTTTYDKATPKLWERVSSNSIGLDSFFDVFYDLSLAKHGVGFGNNPNNLCLTTTYDKATPKLWERVSSNSIGLDSFFDVFYDLSLASYGVGFGNNPNNICLVTRYDPLTPRLTQKISTGLPAVNGFFDITYDLALGRETYRFGIVPEDPDFDLIVVREWDKSTPKLKETISSADPMLVNSFFDITYNLDLGSIKTEHNHNAYTVTSSEPSTICWKFESMLPGTPDFFDICYDMGLGRMETEFNNLKYSHTLLDASKSEVIIESNLPAVQGFFDIIYDIGLPTIQSHSTRAGLLGALPMEMRYEYDAENRKIRQVGTDNQNGSTLSLEWLPGLTGSSLLVSDKLQIQGSLSTPGSGPLVLDDNLMLVGASHQINGMLSVNGPTHQISGMVTVNGNLHVNGTLSATNKTFKIDHPLDPDNKFLVHSCIESPDMMNIYNGNAITDGQGYVTIRLPDYFEALNADFRYQLTCIGQFAQAIVEKKINDNQFVIRTDKPNVEVSWQVTGIRHDPAALQQQYQVEVEKTLVEKEMKLFGNL